MGREVPPAASRACPWLAGWEEDKKVLWLRGRVIVEGEGWGSSPSLRTVKWVRLGSSGGRRSK